MIRDSKVVQSVCYDRDSEEHLLGAVHPQDAHMDHEGKNPHHVGKEDTPAYRALNAANVLCTEHRRKDVSDIFTGVDRPANTDRVANLKAEAQRKALEARGEADAKLINAQANAESERIRAEGAKSAKLLLAQAEAEEIRLHAEARAAGSKSVSEALAAPGGQAAMVQNIAEKYVGELASMARESNMIIVPDKPNDVSSVLSTAMAIGAQSSHLGLAKV